METAASPTPGQLYRHYRLLERIGAGGMGVVYRAMDEVLQREVAVKLLPANVVQDEITRKRLRKEALTLARLNHSNIETVYGLETVGDVDFLVMEYVPGVTLEIRLLRGQMSQAKILKLAIQLASALEAAHAQNVVHGDFKPGNIVITPNDQVKVLDFGLARLMPLADETLKQSASDPSAMAGTLPYLSPEQLRGIRPDTRSDVYALGVVLYEMAAGRRPHPQATMAALVESILRQEPEPVCSLNPQIAPEFAAIIHKAIRKDPALRHQSATELRTDLQRLVAGGSAETMELPRRQPSRLGWAAPAAIVLIIVALLAGYFLTRRPSAPSGASQPPQPQVVAVLPFEAIGGKPENQALCRGLTELLTARLAQASKRYSVEVVPSSEVRSNGVTSADDARKKLGVTLVVEGTWNFAGHDEVTYSLVNARNRRTINAAVINADLKDLLGVERDVVDRLLAMLDVELQPQDRAQTASDRLARPDVYQYYVRGRGYLLDYTNAENLRSAIALFKMALDVDPSFAQAYAALGEAYWRQFQENKDQAAIVKAKDACLRAAALNDELAPVHVTFGLILQSTGKYEDAVKEFSRALELDSTNDAAYRGLATSYMSLGKMKEAEDAYRRAIDMRKDYWGGYSALGAFYNNAARYDEAAAQFRRVIELAPENVRGYTNLGGIYYLQGKYPEAKQLFEKSLAIQPNYRAYTNLGSLYFHEGRYAESARMFDEALKLNDQDSRTWRYAAAAYYWAPDRRAHARAAYQHAAGMIEKELKINPSDSKSWLALADCLSMLGQSRRALQLLRKANALSPPDAESMFRTASIYQQLGDHDSAWEWLGKAIHAGYSIAEIEHDPAFARLREDPRYKQLLQSMGTRAQK
jgi:tetratricopeptide (TPR) repeat protein/tRNA A-37 threonylcarbamoyl transferase component Bud32